MKSTIIKICIFLLMSVLIGFGMVGIDRKFCRPPATLYKTDTIYVPDTTTTGPIEPETVIPDGFELVPAGTCQQLDEQLADCLTTIDALVDSLATKPKIVYDHDTLYVVVPMKDYTFTDGKTYEFAARGYNVSLLWHKSFNQTAYITQTQTEYRDFTWTLYPRIGLYAGQGFIFGQAGIGADISLSKDRRWKLSPEVGYGLVQSNGQFSKGFYGGGSIKYNLIQTK